MTKRHEYHVPVYKSYVWDSEKKRMVAHSLGQIPPPGWE